MAPRRYDLHVYQGEDYERAIPALDDAQPPAPVNVEGWTVVGEIRADHLTAVLLHTLDVEPDGTDVVLRIPAAVSAGWAWRLARYDVALTAPGVGGKTKRLLEGLVLVHPRVSRPA